jgi:molybdopterin synthase sulfur carrier subunit
MEIELRFFATFREAVGSKTTSIEVASDAAVEDVLSALEDEYDGLRGNLIEDGGLAPQINVLLNGREVLHMEGLDTALSPGDTLSIFPPVAGGATDTDRRERSYRGISRRLAAHYLRNLGGSFVDADDPEDATRIEGDGWAADLDAGKVTVGGSLQLTEVRIAFTGEPGVLDDLIDRFAQKAMRAGG